MVRGVTAGGPAPGPLGRQVAGAVRWSALNSVLQRVGQVGVGILLARLIAPEQFGVFAVALVVLNIVLSVAEMGVSVALVRHDGDPGEIAPTVATLSILSGTALAVLMCLGAPAFATALNAPEAAGVIQLMAVSLVVAGVSAVPGAMLQRNFRQDHKLAADGSALVVGTAVAVVLALAGFGAWSLAWSRIATNATAAGVMFRLTTERFRPGYDPAVARSVLRFGLPLAGAGLLVFGVMNVDYIVVGVLLGPVPLAFYLLAFNLSSWPVNAFSQPVRSVSLAAFSRVHEDPVRADRTFGRATGLLALCGVPVCVLLAAFDEPLVRFVYGVRWEPAAQALAALAVLGGVRILLELAYDLLAAAGASRTILVIHIGWLVVLVPLLVVAARLDGIRGVAIGHTVVALLLVAPAYVVAVRRLGVRAHRTAARLVRPLAGGLVMVLVAIAVRHLVEGDPAQLVIGTVLALAAYAVVVFPQRHELTELFRRRTPAAEVGIPT